MFIWIVAHGEHATWVVVDIGDLPKIKKETLNFKGKA